MVSRMDPTTLHPFLFSHFRCRFLCQSCASSDTHIGLGTWHDDTWAVNDANGISENAICYTMIAIEDFLKVQAKALH